jgi:hypothetical protein
MITIRTDTKKLKHLVDELRGLSDTLTREVAIATNEAAKDVKRETARRITQNINLGVSKAKDLIYIKWASRMRATGVQATAHVFIKYEARPSLKYFGARQTKKGVSYKIMKRGARQTIKGAFIDSVGKMGGHVYMRKTEKRLPLAGPFLGLSAWGYFVKQNLDNITQQDAQALLEYRLRRRIRFLTLKAQGNLRGNQK